MVCKLKDIARELKVSVNTVSRALKDMPDISDSLKKTIKEKTAEMGYIPSMSARHLRTGKTGTIAIIYDHYINPYYSIVTSLLQEKLYAKNYSLIIFTERKENKLTTVLTSDILSRGVDGIISFLDVDEDSKKLIEARSVYLLLLGRKTDQLQIDSITTDDKIGGYIAAKHLLECGHREILMLSGVKGVSCFEERLKGFKMAMKEYGITETDNNVMFMGCDGDSEAELLEKASLKMNFTAVFCFNDLSAYAVIKELSGKGIKVPEEVSVIGYDNIESHLPLPIGLTTIDTDKEQVADVAAEVILIKMESKRERRFNKIQTPRLIQGKTVAVIETKK